MKKKIIVIIPIIVMLIALLFISTGVQKSEAFVAKSIITGESTLLLENDGKDISNILENGLWNTEGTSDCFSNVEITIHGATYKYHSDCGTFNDNVNHRSLEINEETKIHVNNILEKYISLASEGVSVE